MKKFRLFLIVFILMISAAAVQAQMSFDEQIALIAANADQWKQDVEYFPWGYVVTDLDHNGRLEIISSSVQGTGFYSYNLAFEVNEAGNALTDLLASLSERTDSAPDIMVSKVPFYFDKEANRYYYIFDDMIRNGMAEYYENKRAISIIDSKWEEIPLANKSTIYTDADHSVTTCSDTNGNNISEAQYDAIAQTVYGNLEAGELCLNWIMTDNEDFAKTTPAQLTDKLKTAANSQCSAN